MVSCREVVEFVTKLSKDVWDIDIKDDVRRQILTRLEKISKVLPCDTIYRILLMFRELYESAVNQMNIICKKYEQAELEVNVGDKIKVSYECTGGELLVDFSSDFECTTNDYKCTLSVESNITNLISISLFGLSEDEEFKCTYTLFGSADEVMGSISCKKPEKLRKSVELVNKTVQELAESVPKIAEMMKRVTSNDIENISNIALKTDTSASFFRILPGNRQTYIGIDITQKDSTSFGMKISVNIGRSDEVAREALKTIKFLASRTSEIMDVLSTVKKIFYVCGKFRLQALFKKENGRCVLASLVTPEEPSTEPFRVFILQDDNVIYVIEVPLVDVIDAYIYEGGELEGFINDMKDALNKLSLKCTLIVLYP